MDDGPTGDGPTGEDLPRPFLAVYRLAKGYVRQDRALGLSGAAARAKMLADAEASLAGLEPADRYEILAQLERRIDEALAEPAPETPPGREHLRDLIESILLCVGTMRGGGLVDYEIRRKCDETISAGLPEDFSERDKVVSLLRRALDEALAKARDDAG